ncbi:MAG: substrate-binding domain-containing protein [Euryarchaeota archaeon]|nr:substrate-binding domain-containing protein [Euryarchaeota archaeon]
MKAWMGIIILLITVGCVLQEQTLKLATTTSTCDTGLLNELNGVFYEKYRVKVQVVCMGTGASIKTGEQGGVDVVIVHAPSLEEASVAEGYYVNRHYLMYNDFVIIGSEGDPAEIRGMKNAAEAFKKIASTQALFISRGDNSGTHIKELELWKASRIEPKGTWYRSIGKGMGATINAATAEQAYSLADRGTYLAVKDNTNLNILVEGDAVLFNPYHVMAVNPEKHPNVKYELAMQYISFLTSPQAQKIISNYGIEYTLDPNTGERKPGFGEALFIPAAMGKEVRRNE